MKKTSALAVVGAAALTLGLAACGDDDDTATTADPSAEATGADVSEDTASTSFNDADVVFAQGMIPHHEQAVEMAEIALDPTVGAGPEVVDLATRIRTAQDPEIELMTGWLSEWGQPMQMDMGDGHDMSSMEGMMTVEDMSALASLTGAEFDQRWMEMMVAHHQGAIAMAETLQAEGSNPEAIELAGQIIAAQQAEIDQLRALLGG